MPAATLIIIALSEPIALILRQTLPAVPFLAQVLFFSWRKFLPTLIVALNFVFFLRT